MGILPLQFLGQSARSLGLTGEKPSPSAGSRPPWPTPPDARSRSTPTGPPSRRACGSTPAVRPTTTATAALRPLSSAPSSIPDVSSSLSPKCGMAAKPRVGLDLRSTRLLGQQGAKERKRVHVGAQEVRDRLGRPVHDRFTAEVEAGVEHDRDAGAGSEPADQPVIQGVSGRDRLQSRRAVLGGSRWDLRRRSARTGCNSMNGLEW